MKKKHNIIPYMIISVMLMFMAYILQFVYRSAKNDTHLVSKDYYKNEINYQSHIDKVKRSEAFEKSTSITTKRNLILIELSKQISNAKGVIYLYNPSNPLLDKQISFEFQSNTPIQIPSDNLKKGNWIVKVDFKTDNNSYYVEQKLSL